MKSKQLMKSVVLVLTFSFLPLAQSLTAESPYPSLPSVLQQKVTSARMRLSRVPTGTSDLAVSEIYGQLGMIYQAGNQPEIAILNYAQAYKLNDKEPKWMYLMAYLLEQQGRAEESYALYRKAFEINDNYVPTLLRIALSTLNNQQYDEAKGLFQRLVKISRYEAVSYEGLGQIALKQGDFDQAVGFFKDVLKHQPGANRNYYYLAQAYRKKGNVDLAKAALEKRGEVTAGFPDPLLSHVKGLYATGQQYLEKGIQQIKSGNYQQALALFNKGIETEPENLTLKTALGRALEYQGKTKQAEAVYIKVLTIDATNNIALFNLAALNDALGNSKIAREYYLKTLDSQADNLDALSLLASLEYRLGNFKQASKHFNRILVLNPNLYDARVYLGMTYLASDECETGAKVLWGALKLKPSDGNVALVLSVAEAQCRNNKQAWELVNTVYYAAPGFKSARFAALVAGYLGKFSDALDLQRQAMFEALKSDGLAAYPDLQHNLKRYNNNEKPQWSWKLYSQEIAPLPPSRKAR